jgi:AcrR family transcriptional regulator
MTQASLAPVRRSPGRPSRISRTQIVAASLRLLEADGLPAFTMAKLAKEVGVSVMALYTYFPSRSALLDDAADSLFATFEPPAEGRTWEETVRNWIASLHRGFQQRPIALHLIKWDEHLAPAWLRVWLPMVRALRAEGLAGPGLVFACGWLSGAVMGAIQASFSSLRTEALTALVGQSGLSEADDALLAEVARSHDPAQRAAMFEFEVDNVIRGLRLLLEAPRPAR